LTYREPQALLWVVFRQASDTFLDVLLYLSVEQEASGPLLELVTARDVPPSKDIGIHLLEVSESEYRISHILQSERSAHKVTLIDIDLIVRELSTLVVGGQQHSICIILLIVIQFEPELYRVRS
jgi:hypothetical protein